MSRTWLLLPFCLAVAYLTLFYQLGRLPFIGADEPRYARIAEEMNLSADYVTPTLHGLPWLEKPPLLYWLSSLSFRLIGTGEQGARLPVALLGLMTALFVAFFTWRIRGPRAGVMGFLILLTSGLFVLYSRAASTDLPLTFGLSLALLSAYLAAGSRSLAWSVLAGVGLALAVLAKGPVAVVLLAGILLLFSMLTGSIPWTLLQVLTGSLVFLGLSTPWYWLVWHANGYSFVATFFINHHLARFLTTVHHHDQPFWYFVPVVLFGFFPWVILLGSAAGRLLRHWKAYSRPNFQPELFLWIWVVVPFVFFSASSSKLAGYILPVIPALAILAGIEWDRLVDRELAAFRAMKIEFSLLAAFTLVVSIGVIVGFQVAYRSLGTGVLIAIPLLAGLVAGHFELRRRRLENLFLLFVAVMTVTFALLFLRAAPVIGRYHSARDISQAAVVLLPEGQQLVLYRYFHHTALYYTGYRCTEEAIPDAAALRRYISTTSAPKYLLLTQRQGKEDLEQLFGARVVLHEGNLFLMELSPRVDSPGDGSSPGEKGDRSL